MEMTNTIKTCRGIPYKEIVGDGTYFWLIKIRKPFYNGGKFWFSLNDKFFQEAEMSGVSKFIVMVGEKEIFVPVLNKKELEVKEMKGEVEIIPSKFEGMSPWRRYLFPLEDYNKSKVEKNNQVN